VATNTRRDQHSALGESVVTDPLAYLAHAGEVLAGSLDLDQTLDHLCALVVPALADICAVHLLDDEGRLRLVALRHASGELEMSDVLGRDYLDAGKQTGPVHRLLEQGVSFLISPVDESKIDQILGPGRGRLIVRALDITSAMMVPLTARGRSIGVLGLATTARPIFGDQQQRLAEDLARRAAPAIDSARLYQVASDSRRAAERARQRTAFLAEASAMLASSLDVPTTLQTVVRLAVPLLAESCSAILLDDDGRLCRVAAAHVDPVRQRLFDREPPIIPVEGRPDHPLTVALATGRPIVDNAVTDETHRRYASGGYLEYLRKFGMRARMVVPLEARGRRIGALVLATAEPARIFDQDDVALGTELASRAALAIDNARLHRAVADSERALHRLVHQLMQAQEEERRRLAYEIHDGFAQVVSGLRDLLEAYAHDVPATSEASHRRLGVAIGVAGRAVEEIRRVLGGLRPTVLDDFGLERGLRAYTEGLTADGLLVTLASSLGTERLASPVEIALFRLVQEALSNVRKHAGVGAASVRLDRADDAIVVEVEDDGQGFDLTALEASEQLGQHLGLLGMRERITQIGGTFELRSRRGAGTVVRAVVPRSKWAQLSGREKERG
jgi:signal transduction histidine kinase